MTRPFRPKAQYASDPAALGSKRMVRKGYDAFSPEAAPDQQKRVRKLLRFTFYGAAAILVLVAGAGAWNWYGQYLRSLEAQLVKQGASALEQRDYGQAVLAYRRLTQFHPSRIDYRFRLGQSLDGVGDLDQAEKLMQSLVSDEGSPYLPAQLWFARRDLRSTDPTKRAGAEVQLKAILDSKPADTETLHALAQYYVEIKRFDEAESLLNRVPDALPETRLQLAKALATAGQFPRAQAVAAGLPAVFRERAAHSDDPQPRLDWAQATALCGDLRDAREILREGLVLNPVGPFAIELAKMCLDASRALEKQASQDPAVQQQRQHWIERGLEALEFNRAPPDHFLLYQLYRGLQSPDKALAHLEEAVKRRPELLVELARFNGVLGNGVKARGLAKDALDSCRARLNATPGDETLRIAAAEAAVLLKDYPQAVALLEEGWTLSRDRRFAESLANTYLAWWDLRSREGKLNIDDLKLLRTALGWDPRSAELGKRLDALRDVGGDFAAPVRSLIAARERALAAPNVP